MPRSPIPLRWYGSLLRYGALLAAGLCGFLESPGGGCATAVASDAASTASPVASGLVQVEINGRVLWLAPGFEIEVAAGPPLVERPICADFDEAGRLYVAEAAGSSDKIEDHIATKPHRVLRLEDVDGDGRFDRRTIFADGLMIPQGAMWLAGSLYVAAPPSIWRLTDTNGDGVCDEREEWFRGQATGGCANDVRGPYLGPDGWIYWCKGTSVVTEARYKRPDKPDVVSKAQHVFRCRPDGSEFEPLVTGGMDNPVEVAFTAGGEALFTTTQFQNPGMPRTDGLFHAVYGGVYPKDLASVHEHPWTGPTLQPVLAAWGASAPAGITCYQSDIFGPQFQHNVFVAHFNFHKVTRHKLTAAGATFASAEEDFLTSTDVDFHPTDVLEDADGSLLVIETGGWYRFCCPSSSLFKPEVLGAIYRIRRSGAERSEDPRGQRLNWHALSPSEAVQLLADPRPAVRWRAVQLLAQQANDAVPAVAEVIRSHPDAVARRHAVWAACRIAQPDARAAVRTALADDDETVRQAALHAVSRWRDAEAMPQLLRLLEQASAHNRRAAAEAIGRIGSREAVPALLKVLEHPADRMLEHSLTFALIEIADRQALLAGLASASPHSRRAALMALDQMAGGSVEPQAVFAAMKHAEPRLREAAWWIAERHLEWGAALIEPLEERLTASDLDLAAGEALAERLGRLARAPAVRDWLGGLLTRPGVPGAARLTVVRAMRQSALPEVPLAWQRGMVELLASASDELRNEALATVQAWRLPATEASPLPKALLRMAGQASLDAMVRLRAMAAVPGGLAAVTPELMEFLIAQFEPDVPVEARVTAAEVFAQARLSGEQLCRLAAVLRTAGPLELPRLLEAFAQTADPEVGRELVAALMDSAGRSSLRPEALRQQLGRFGPALAKETDALIALVEAATAEQRAKLDELLAALSGLSGDVRRGHAVFHASKAACAACHAIAYVGGRVGPALTQIGQVRSERDLLESIVFPSATLVQGYEGVVVATSDGRVVTGVVVRDAPEVLVLATGPNQQVAIPREEIEEIEKSKVSIMPSGLDQQLSRQDLADLLAFLKSCK
ncbi:MAG: HEAT repeat domain-containing protein [Pirellulales bacterium]|nr:HEAT repeat domain-containing protein [Pirellulales bacterium]